MDRLFAEIMEINGVKGAMLFSTDGEMVHKEFSETPPVQLEDNAFWANVFSSFKGMKESEIVTVNCRLYIKETTLGFILIWMKADVRIALIRLNCDIIIASLEAEKKKPSKGKWSLFGFKKS